ncbi:hypothetical protein TSH58p_22760 (plasmid) [Azospirillum sp. TSH58]|uniref:hypothetical protein n=1 Tax=Azospirillum sp. TSH58 TaxID=664962 RepID=UPI000D5FE34A|nr:hypothetical protein [Azospirillum sp. TSH58]AWJ86339.1 hypothetical protein TSH58p_22760 [Azospirillum sp. TSH58]PWC73414.1 hypothetical protein TSH58_04355 [Azospirillum sp. TSH58]
MADTSITNPGHVTWHYAEGDGTRAPGVVGMTVSLGEGRHLYVGEVSQEHLADLDPNLDLPADPRGWWITLDTGTGPDLVAKPIDISAGHWLIQTLGVAMESCRRAGGCTNNGSEMEAVNIGAGGAA